MVGKGVWGYTRSPVIYNIPVTILRVNNPGKASNLIMIVTTSPVTNKQPVRLRQKGGRII